MTDQPTALRLADAMTRALEQTDAEDDVIQVARWFVEDSRAELRRLSAVNQELLEALKLAQSIIGHPDDAHSQHIAAVIAKVEAQP
jgi:hypothetical protein